MPFHIVMQHNLIKDVRVALETRGNAAGLAEVLFTHWPDNSAKFEMSDTRFARVMQDATSYDLKTSLFEFDIYTRYNNYSFAQRLAIAKFLMEKFEDKESIEAREAVVNATIVYKNKRAKTLEAAEKYKPTELAYMKLDKRKRDEGESFTDGAALKRAQSELTAADYKRQRESKAEDDALDILMYTNANLRNAREKFI
jgi:hypothetical protein